MPFLDFILEPELISKLKSKTVKREWVSKFFSVQGQMKNLQFSFLKLSPVVYRLQVYRLSGYKNKMDIVKVELLQCSYIFYGISY